MKTKLMMVATILLFGIGLSAQAQGKGFKNEKRRFDVAKMDSMRCQRMTNELMLNDATTAKFKAMYMDYLADMRNAMMPAGKIDRNAIKRDPLKEMTDAEVQKMLENRFDREQKMLDVRVKYYKEFKRFLSPKQIARIFRPRFQGKRMMHPRFLANKEGNKRMHQWNGQMNKKWNKQDKNGYPQQPVEKDN
ncbi:MAG: hypothetical protein GX416_05195 [Bacteroidales bacterium]|nr:hypothetical protein [Bacteroidales bacterium]